MYNCRQAAPSNCRLPSSGPPALSAEKCCFCPQNNQLPSYAPSPLHSSLGLADDGLQDLDQPQSRGRRAASGALQCLCTPSRACSDEDPSVQQGRHRAAVSIAALPEAPEANLPFTRCPGGAEPTSRGAAVLAEPGRAPSWHMLCDDRGASTWGVSK